jgi:hypothetical protein
MKASAENGDKKNKKAVAEKTLTTNLNKFS